MRNPEEEYLANLRNLTGRGDLLNYGCDIRVHLPLLRFLAVGNVVEIGCRRTACSTSALLCGVMERGGHVYSIDLEEEGPCSDVFAGHPQWTFIKGHSCDDYEAIIAQIPRPINLLFIDGAHSQSMVLSDLQKYEPLVKPGGFTLLHDTDFWDGNADYCGVRQGIEKYGKPAEFLPGSFGLGIIRKQENWGF
jgi:cephalosporin hydroxylase